MMEPNEPMKNTDPVEKPEKPEKPETPAAFETRLEQVRGVIERIESGQLHLEDSVKQYEVGMQALSVLERELGEMKRRITVLQSHSEGTLTEKEMEEIL